MCVCMYASTSRRWGCTLKLLLLAQACIGCHYVSTVLMQTRAGVLLVNLAPDNYTQPYLSPADIIGEVPPGTPPPASAYIVGGLAGSASRTFVGEAKATLGA